MKTRSCLTCGAALTLRRGHAVTCSPACRQALYRARRATPFPAEMRAAARWVRWERTEHRGRPVKLPRQPNGQVAAVNRPSTWSTFAAVEASRVGHGVGYMLGDGIGCYDLDGAVVDGRLEPWALDVLQSIPEPVIFTEVSQSGRGAHVFVRAVEGRGSVDRRGNGRRVERYTSGRYIAMTGAPLYS